MEIQTRQLAVGYQKKVIVDEISLQIEAGKILTLIGPNGCGKSTILKTITRQLQPLQGQIFLLKKEMHKMADAEIARHLSMVMTERIHPELMSCRELAATGRYPYTGRLGILSEKDWEKVDEALELVGAMDIAKEAFLEISDGQKQRVMLARAICQEPEILVLDEPTSYLDLHYKLQLLEIIRRLAREKGMAILMSLHELDLACQISDEIACVANQKIQRIGQPEEIFCGSYLQELYEVEQKAFDPLLGSMFVKSSKGEPRVFVIAGGGSGIPVFRRLAREQIPFSVGILSENDLDFPFAQALASEVIAEKAFQRIGNTSLSRAKERILSCEACICTLKEFGPQNQENKELLDFAVQKHKLISSDMLPAL